MRVRALLSPTKEGQLSTRLVLKGMFGRATQATARLKLWAARALLKPVSKCVDRLEKASSPRFEGMFREAMQAIRCGRFSDRYGKLREGHVYRHGAVALVS